MSNTPVITVSNLSKTFDSPEGPLHILRSIDLSIPHGESVAIMGPSGSGKSTLLALMAGLDTPSIGEISLMGHALNKLSEEERTAVRAQHVGFIFQQFALIPSLTALENVMLPLELKGVKQARNRAEHWLELVGLKDRLYHTPKILSGGEQQRVAIARAYASEPDIIFADEPTGNLDTHTGDRIIQLMFDHQSKHTTLVLITHDQTLASSCHKHYQLISGALE